MEGQHKCRFIKCKKDSVHTETFKVLNFEYGMYQFTTHLCDKHHKMMYNFKERVAGDFSVFLKDMNDVEQIV